MSDNLTLQKKICLIGDFAVGKTSLIRQYVHSEFSEDYLTTIGVHITKKELHIDNTTINLLIWDIAGRNGIQDINNAYLQGAAGAIMVGDISRVETMLSLKGHYDNFQRVNSDCPMVASVNKVDLLEELDPEINPDSSWELGLESNIPLFKTSAKTAEQVETMFLELTKLILEKHG